MAKKNKPSIDGAIIYFKEVMTRASLNNYVCLNNTLISNSPNNYSVIIIPDHELWINLLLNEEFKNTCQELNNNDYNKYNHLFKFADDLYNIGWLDIDNEDLFKGKILKVKIKDMDYDIPIGKDLLPLKLRKAEFNNVSYRVFNFDGHLYLGLKKVFIYDLKDCNFTMMRVLKII